MITSRPLRFLLGVAAAALAALPTPVFAQAIEVPAPSAKARVDQRVGVTDFSIEYSSPAVRGRKIWGDLVPYGELWRTGANAATKLTVSREFTVGGKKVPAGSYALLTIPGESSWTVILNTASGMSGTSGYDEKNDVARVTVKPETAGPRERMTFLFSDTTDDATRLDLEWASLRVSVPIQVDTAGHVRAAIDKALADSWRPHYTAGRYLFDSGGDLDTALQYLDASIGIKGTWWNYWYRAQVLGKKNRPADAVAAAEKAMQLGKGDEIFEQFFKENVQKAIDGWKKGKA